MKKIAFAIAAATFLTTQAQAGAMSAPVMEPKVVAETAARDSAEGPIVMALAILTVLAVGLSHSQ